MAIITLQPAAMCIVAPRLSTKSNTRKNNSICKADTPGDQSPTVIPQSEYSPWPTIYDEEK